MNKEPISVSKLTLYIKGLMEKDDTLNKVFIKGEISNFKHHSSGHMYFTLKDEYSKIRCIMFRGSNMHLKFIPEDGMNVIIEGYVSLYERDGQYQLYCNLMEPDGIGSLYLAFEQMKEKLKKEGLFDIKRKRKLPLFPKRIGVATSKTGAVIRDIINVSTKRFNGVNILLYPVKVQGEGAAKSIVEAIGYFNSREDIDIIIIGRGGGSIEELWAFNEEILARAIFDSKIPIISAVGHETDFTIADFVADARASTPSHAAEIAVPSCYEIEYKIKKSCEMIINHIENSINQRNYKLKGLNQQMNTYSPQIKINRYMQFLDNLQNKIIFEAQMEVSNQKTRVSVYSGKLDSLSPLKVLSRGYAFVEKDNIVVKGVKSLNREDNIKLHLYDGKATCKVIDVMEGK